MNDNTINTEVTMRDAAHAGGPKRFRAGDEILGRYVVESELGQGGMGVVYLCLDKVGGVKVAVKGLPPEVSHNSDEMESVRENFQLVSELQHPNIAGVRTLEKDEKTGDYYLVMAYARGVSLKRWLRQHGGKEHRGEQLKVLRQIASALDYAHNAEPRHIIHRDIKPENVMVDEHGKVSVLDFGLAAQVRSSLSRVSQVVTSRSGTPAYKSPEQWLAQAQRAPSDQYSLGVIAYQMFAGELPFDSDDLDILKHAVAFDPVPRISSESKAANAVFTKVLAKKPQDRFPSCTAFVDALAGERGAESSANRTRIAVWGLLALAVLVGVGGWWLLDGDGGLEGWRSEETSVQTDFTVKESAVTLLPKSVKEPTQDQVRVAMKNAENKEAVFQLPSNVASLTENGGHKEDASVTLLNPEEMKMLGLWTCAVSVRMDGKKMFSATEFIKAHLPVDSAVTMTLSEDGTVILAEASGRMFGRSRGRWRVRHGMLIMELENEKGRRYGLSGTVEWQSEDGYALKFDNSEFSAMMRQRCDDIDGLNVVLSSYVDDELELLISVTSPKHMQACAYLAPFRFNRAVKSETPNAEATKSSKQGVGAAEPAGAASNSVGRSICPGEWKCYWRSRVRMVFKKGGNSSERESITKNVYRFYRNGDCMLEQKIGEKTTSWRGRWSDENDMLMLRLKDQEGREQAYSFRIMRVSDHEVRLAFGDIAEFERRFLTSANVKSSKASYDETGRLHHLMETSAVEMNTIYEPMIMEKTDAVIE